MSCRSVLVLLFYFSSFGFAWQAPTYNGYQRMWSSSFEGRAGSLPDTASWSIVTGDNNFNNENQRYTSSNLNLQLSGGGTVQLIPLRDRSAPGGWTSARIESKYVISPTYGKITRIEASLRLGSSSSQYKQGIWPAFWALGYSYRHGIKWPACGEIDIMENINGQNIGYGVAHCHKTPGGLCNEDTGIAATAPIPNSDFHVWRVEFDRRSSDFRSQSVTWYMDGRMFNKMTGSQIGSADVWKTLCQDPMYLIFNVAVGGFWPGAPNTYTLGGTGSMMEVGYVAHYVSY